METARPELVEGRAFVDRGHGPALVLIPGLQGRWEYMRPAVEALSASFRVLTFPLADERSSGWPFDAGRGLDSYADHVQAVLDAARVTTAVICGVSFGGLIAARFAATHARATAALVLTSTPPPAMRLRRRHQIYVRLPWVLGPLLLAETPWRLQPELRKAMPDGATRRCFSRQALATLVRAPVSLSRMADRARLLTRSDLRADCARITAPTLIVTGEPGLDFVVPVAGTSEYLSLIPHAHHAIIERTGHLGSVTRPDAFAATVREFVAADTEIRFPDAAA